MTNTNADAKAAAQSHAGDRLIEAAKAKILAQENPKPKPDTKVSDDKVVEPELSNAERNRIVREEYFAAKKARQAQGEEPASIDVHGQNKRTGAVHNVDAGVVSRAEVAIPTPTLDPRNITSLDEYEGHADLLGPAARALEMAHKAVTEIFAARDAAASNPEWTPATQIIKVAEYAAKAQERATKAFDTACANMAKTIASFEAELSKPLETSNQTVTTVALAGEIRAHVKQLDASDRQKFMREAFAAKDVKTLQSVLSGPSYLSGFDMAAHDYHTRRFHEMQNPLIVSRLAAIRKAQAHLDRAGPLILSEVTRAIGVGEGGWTKINKLKAASNAAHAVLIFNDLA